MSNLKNIMAMSVGVLLGFLAFACLYLLVSDHVELKQQAAQIQTEATNFNSLVQALKGTASASK